MARKVRRVKYRPRRNPRRRRSARKNPGNTLLWLALLGGGAYLLWKKKEAKALPAAAPAAKPASEDASGAVSATVSFSTAGLGSLGGNSLGTLG